MLPRVYPSDSFPAGKSWLEYQKIKEKKFKSTIASDWRPIGPLTVPNDRNDEPSGVGRVNCIAFHPTNSSMIYVGTPAAGGQHTDQ